MEKETTKYIFSTQIHKILCTRICAVFDTAVLIGKDPNPKLGGWRRTRSASPALRTLQLRKPTLDEGAPPPIIQRIPHPIPVLCREKGAVGAQILRKHIYKNIYMHAYVHMQAQISTHEKYVHMQTTLRASIHENAQCGAEIDAVQIHLKINKKCKYVQFPVLISLAFE